MRTFTLEARAWGALVIAGFAVLIADRAAAQECATDSDCSSVWGICQVSTDCPCSPGSGGSTGSICPAPGETCHGCYLRYFLPCETAADCGPGFACDEETSITCDGTGGGPAPSGAGANCHQESMHACRLLALPCASNSDCADGMDCQDNPAHRCIYEPLSGAGGVGECVLSDAPPYVCAPPGHYGDSIDGRGEDGCCGTGSTGSGGRGGAGGAGPFAGNVMGSGGALGGNVGASAGTGGLASSGGGGNGAILKGAAGNAGSHGDQSSGSGCSVSGSDASAQISTWLALIAIAACGMRRRARRVWQPGGLGAVLDETHVVAGVEGRGVLVYDVSDASAPRVVGEH